MGGVYLYTKQSDEIQHLKVKDPILGEVIDTVGDLEYSLRENVYEFIVETIVGQMLSNKVANTIFKRLKTLCNNDVSAVNVRKLEKVDLREIGLSNQKSEYVLLLSEKYYKEPHFFNELPHKPDDYIMKSLMCLRGVGSWTAKMYLIFSLNRLDILPYEDGAFIQAYKWLYETNDISKTSIEARCSSWKPYSSLAARYLYRLLDEGYVKRDKNLV